MRDNITSMMVTIAAVAVVAFVLLWIFKNVDAGCINLGFWKSCGAAIKG